MKEPVIKINSKIRQAIDREIYEVSFNDKIYTYIDYFDKEGNVVDAVVKDQNENYIYDPEIVQELIQFVYEQQQ